MSRGRPGGRALIAAFAVAWCSAVGGCGRDTERPQVAEEIRTAPAESTVGTVSTAPPSTQPSGTKPERRPSRATRSTDRVQSTRAHPDDHRPLSSPAAETVPSPTPPVETVPPPKPKVPTEDDGPPAHRIKETATLSLVRRNGAKFVVQQGPFVGTLSGEMLLRARLAGEGVTGTFTVTLADGTLQGRASASLKLSSDQAVLQGTARIRAGTGRYTGATSEQLTFTGSVKSDVSSSRIHVTGVVYY